MNRSWVLFIVCGCASMQPKRMVVPEGMRREAQPLPRPENKPPTPALQGAPAPWNALAPMTLAWSNLHLGVCYFIPLDILCGAWFFYLLRKGLEVYGFAMGWRDLGWDAKGFPFT